ncbi:MAG: DNA-3-methyladenine glycosylase 2 family protein [Clostridiales bacterium]|nr:DNA-3-methyladenine glycosylase 2 family protein [Candidatus Apopatousia equi]
MKYTKEKDRIIIEKCEDFNAEHILECGQVFRYKKVGNKYLVFSTNKCAEVFEENDKIIIKTSDVDYFENYFDLTTDYANIKSEIVKVFKQNYKDKDFKFLLKAIDYGKGIRILKQNFMEAMLSFVISQNNNIKRIQLIVERMCERYGTNMGSYYAFPTLEQLEKITLNEYSEMGLGYRASYMVEVVKMLGSFDYDKFTALNSDEKLKFLLNTKGIGPKVADCIMLFGFYEMKVFPVDTWIVKVFNEYFDNKVSDRKVMRKTLVDIFDIYAGYAQQYLFYYQRLKN